MAKTPVSPAEDAADAPALPVIADMPPQSAPPRDPNFMAYDWRTGKLDDCDQRFPTAFYASQGSNRDFLAAVRGNGAVFGYVAAGRPAVLTVAGVEYPVHPGMYFVADGAARLRTRADTKLLLMVREGADFPFMLGGPIEREGRLRYIDGCTDSLLIAPWRLGEPCLNHLHFPPGTDQTQHTHPSDRLGVVIRGSGWCVTPVAEYPLEAGMLWRIPAGGLHKFRTPDDSGMDVLAFHPDSDFGPTDRCHPMLNRTIIEGIPASAEAMAMFWTK